MGCIRIGYCDGMSASKLKNRKQGARGLFTGSGHQDNHLRSTSGSVGARSGVLVAEWKSPSPICLRDHLRCGLSKCAVEDLRIGDNGSIGGGGGMGLTGELVESRSAGTTVSCS